MQKIGILLIALCFGIQGMEAFSQCTPSTMYSTDGLHPNPLPGGALSSPYNQSVTIVFPYRKDTTVTITGFGTQTFTAYFTQFEVTQVSGLPQGMTMPLSSCNLSNCKYPITQNQVNRGCMTLSGTPTESGTFQITTTNYANGYTIMPFSVPFVINAGDTLNFDDPRVGQIPGASGLISGLRTFTFSTPLQIQTTGISAAYHAFPAKLFPNPGLTPKLEWTANSPTSILITDALGKTLFQTTTSENFLFLPSFPNGLYFVKLSNHQGQTTLKWSCNP